MDTAALLRSLARKMARAPPPAHPRPFLRQLHGSARSGPGASLPPLPTKIQDGRSPNQSLRPSAKLARFVVIAGAGTLLFSGRPMVQELKDKNDALARERDALKKAVEECRRKHTHVFPDSSLAQSMQASGRGLETDGQLSS